MVVPSDISGFLSGAVQGLLPNIMRWTGIVVISAVILGAFYFVYLLFLFNISVQCFILGETIGKDGHKKYQIRGVRTLRARKTMVGGISKFSYLFSTLKTEPIPSRFIMPFYGILVKSTTFVYDIDGEIHLPSAVDFNINPTSTISFTPLPYEIKRAASLELHEIAKEFQEDTFMAKYGNMFYMLLTIIFCLVLVGIVIVSTYKYIGGELGVAAGAANNMADAFREGVIQKFAP